MSMEELDIAMQEMPKAWRNRWCGGGACACLGAANCSGGLSAKGFTKQQWEQWKSDNETEQIMACNSKKPKPPKKG